VLIIHCLLLAVIACAPFNKDEYIGRTLDKIEAVEIESMTATISYTRTDPILDRKEIRTGKVLFRQGVDTSREAAILFDSLIIGQRREKIQKHYIFSGRWMAEIDHEHKQFIKRELVSPDEKEVDPFELGSGPIPLPIGQSKESVLKQFNVTIAHLPTEGPLSHVHTSSVGLHLVPKGESDWEYIDLFYDPETWLPVAVRTMETDGTKRVSRLTHVQLNKLSEEDAKLLSIETPDPTEWSIDIQPIH
jgi:hypothetical protein